MSNQLEYIRIQSGTMGFPGGAVVKNLPANARDTGGAGRIPGSGRSPGVGNVSPLQCSCLENPVDRGAWWAAVHGVAESPMRACRSCPTLCHQHTSFSPSMKMSSFYVSGASYEIFKKEWSFLWVWLLGPNVGAFPGRSVCCLQHAQRPHLKVNLVVINF